MSERAMDQAQREGDVGEQQHVMMAGSERNRTEDRSQQSDPPVNSAAATKLNKFMAWARSLLARSNTKKSALPPAEFTRTESNRGSSGMGERVSSFKVKAKEKARAFRQMVKERSFARRNKAPLTTATVTAPE